MQKVFCRFLTVAFVALSAVVVRAADKDPVVARYHFAGTAQLTAKNYENLRKILGQPSSVQFRDLVLNRFASKIAGALSASNGNSGSSAVRPMLDDLFANESTGVFGEPGNGPEAFVIAAHLSKERQAAWVQNIKKLSNALRVQQQGEWVVVASGNTLKSAEDDFISEIRKNNRPVPVLKGTILEAKIDWPRLSNVPAVAQLPFKPAVLQVNVAPKGNNLRTEIHAHYPQPIDWKSQQWKLPTETIRDPLVSFTAGQNAAAFMKRSQLAERIGENPFTNQYFIYATLNIPFETAALFPIKNAKQHLQNLGRELPSRFNPELKKNNDGQLKWIENTNQLVWRDLPILVPYVKTVHEKAGDFLRVGTFLHAASGPPVPSELWSQFNGRNDLVYYDWEVSGPRLMQWRMTAPLLPLFPMARTNHIATPKTKTASPLTPTTIVDNWLGGLAPALSPTKENPSNGNVVTEVTRNSASDYTLVRNSQVGFTAIELMLMSHWLSDTKVASVRSPNVPAPAAPQSLQKAK
jgi:hypothetical protein